MECQGLPSIGAVGAAAIETELLNDKNNAGKYVWYTYFTAKDMKKTDKAQVKSAS